MIRARFSPKAARDLDEASHHIAADNPEVAERVRQTILNTSDFLASILNWGGVSAMPPCVTRKSAGSSCRSFAII
jgi:plasmid stabilization system protein ParE